MRRTVFLVDMNAFFISCETTRNSSLKGKPAAVAGDPFQRSGIILAASYEARACGVRTTMTLQQARRLCPDIILVPPDHDFYSQRSKEVMDLLSEFSPLVEPNSIDEAWLDMSGCESLFGAFQFSSVAIMKRINLELGLPCSIGIAENKFLSKMASEFKKPHGISTLWSEEIPNKLWPLAIKDMYGVGQKTAEKLIALQIRTIGDLAKVSPVMVRGIFGKNAEEYVKLANGVDLRPVVSERDEVRSIGRSTTLSYDYVLLDEAKLVLMDLAEEVGESARRHELHGRTIQITMKYADFQSITRQVSTAPTNLTKDIIYWGLQLLEKNWDTKKPVRLLGISLSGFEPENGQLSMFDLPQEGNNECSFRDQKEVQLETAIDDLRKKYGASALKRAALLPNTKKK